MKSIFLFVRSIISIPSFLFHELCHLIVMAIFFPIVTVIWKDSKGYMIINMKEQKYGLGISFDCRNQIVCIMIAAAPVIGWAVAYFLCIFYHSLFVVYLLLPLNWGLSLADENAIINNIFRMTAKNVPN